MALTKYERNKRWRKNRPEVWNAMRQRYYKRSELKAFNKKQIWTVEDCNMILLRYLPDSNIAELIGRSVKAIQVKRARLKKRK